MKKLNLLKLLSILWLLAIGGAHVCAQDTSTSVTVNPPTITPDGGDYDGTITATISTEDGNTLRYKWGSSAYTKNDMTSNSTKVTIVDNNVATTKKSYTSTRVLTAVAVKEVNGTYYYSDVKAATFTYVKDTKKTLTLSAEDFKIDINKTQQIKVTAKDGTTEISGLPFVYTSDNPDVATVDSKTGVVTGVMAGNATITISFAGNDQYKEASTTINVGVNSNATSTAEGTIFTNIADVREAGQIKNSIDWILQFSETNPATVVAVFSKDDPDFDDKKGGAGNVFIVDKSGRGLMLPVYPSDKNLKYINGLKVGDKLTGYLVGQYKERQSGMPEFTILNTEITKDGTTYKTDFTIDTTGETSADGNPEYPLNDIKDVNTIVNTNDKNGNIVTSSYGIYLNTIVSVPGVIRKGAAGEYYLVQDEKQPTWGEDDADKRLYINTTQIGINIEDYANTAGTFEGIVIKKGKQYAKLVVLKNNFFQINKIYLDENDDENRINDLVNAGAFDDEVDVYVHRTKLVNSYSNMWNTLCFPFDMTAEEFKTAFGCELTALAAPKITGNTDASTKIGDVDAEGNLLFEPKTDLTIEAGMPYLMKATGTQEYSANTSIKYDGTSTPQDYIAKDSKYYASVGQKFITVVPPHQIEATYNGGFVNGDFYFRGLYGRKQYTDDKGTPTQTPISDNGSEKYQYISTKDNYLYYLPSGSTLKFPGMRAYFYFPHWDKEGNDKAQQSGSTQNSKVQLRVIGADDGGNTTGIANIPSANTDNNAAIYSISGQRVNASYKGLVIKNGRKYIMK